MIHFSSAGGRPKDVLSRVSDPTDEGKAVAPERQQATKNAGTAGFPVILRILFQQKTAVNACNSAHAANSCQTAPLRLGKGE